MDRADFQFVASVELSIHKALLGEVIPSLRCIYIGWNPGDEKIRIYICHNGSINDATKDHYFRVMGKIETQTWKKQLGLIYEIIRCDYPEPIPKKDCFIITYERKEPFLNPSY